MTKKLNVIVSGRFFPVTSSLEYFIRAFSRRDDVNLITVGPAHGTSIPWGTDGGMHLPQKYVIDPDIKLPSNTQHVPYSYLKTKLPVDFEPDLIFENNNFFIIDGKPKLSVKATFLPDPHCVREEYNKVTKNYDFVFCPQTYYAEEGEYYLPFAYDSKWHSPTDVPLEKIYDVALIGNTYVERIQLMEKLSKKHRIFFKLGPAKEDARNIYNQSIVGVNWSSKLDLTARVFELMGLGIIPVCNRIPDLLEMFEEDKHFIGFTGESEAIEKIDDILSNMDKYGQVATEARKVAVEGKHSWDDRVQSILETCGLVDNVDIKS